MSQFLKILFFRLSTALMLVLDLFKPKSKNDLRIGIVTCEIFHPEVRGIFGGFGMTVRNVSTYFNHLADPRFRADVLVDCEEKGKTYVRRINDTDVISNFKENPGLSNSLDQFSYMNLLRKRRLNTLITIEYYRSYERLIMHAPSVPVLIWIHDPRAEEDWKRIASVPMEASLHQAEFGKELEGRVTEVRQSIKRLLANAAKINRKIIFAHQSDFLVPKAKKLYALPDMKSVRLLNPIYFEEVETEKTERPSFLYLGRLDPVKRPWIFFELSKRMPNYDFFVAGLAHDPKLMSPIIRKYESQKNLKFLGLVDGHEKWKLIKRSWVMVNTSIHEALPVSYLEAFSCHTTVVSSNVDPDGLVARFGEYAGDVWGEGLDEAGLGKYEKALKTLVTDHDLRKSKTEAAYRYVRENHSFEQFQKNLKAIVDKYLR